MDVNQNGFLLLNFTFSLVSNFIGLIIVTMGNIRLTQQLAGNLIGNIIFNIQFRNRVIRLNLAARQLLGKPISRIFFICSWRTLMRNQDLMRRCSNRW
jgi:hypothetical protein